MKGQKKEKLSITSEDFFTIRGVIFLVLGKNGRVYDINKMGCKFLGYSKKKIVGKIWFDNFLPKKIKKEVKEVFRKITTEKIEPLKYYENNILTKSGEEKIVAWHHNRLKDEKGNVLGILSLGFDITDKKKSEQALRIREARFKNLFEINPDTVFFINMKGIFEEINLPGITGYSKQEAIGKHFKEVPFFTEKTKQIALEKLKKRKKGEKLSPYTIEIKTKDGEIRFAEVSSTQVIVDNKVIGILGVARDITDRKKTEEKIKNAKDDWENIFQAIGQPAIILGSDHKILAANKATVEATGKTEKQLLGEFCYEIFHSSNKPPAKCPLKALLDSGETDTVEMEMEAFNGVFLVSCTPVLSETGELEKIIHIATDITERKKTERELRLKDNAMKSSINAIAISDLKENLIYINTSFLKIWGYSEEDEVLGKPAADFWKMGHKAKEVIYALKEKGKWFGELTGKKKNGTLFPVQVSANVVKDDKGKPVSMMSSFIDLTELKQAEKDLMESEEKYRSFVENFPGIAFRSNVNWIPIYFHGSVEEITGYTEQDFIAGNPRWDQIIIPEDRTKLIENYPPERFNDPEYVATRDYRIRRKDGKICWVQDTVRGIIDDKGIASVLQGTIRDITEQKKVEEKLKWLSTIVEQSTEGMALSDLNGKLLFVNNAWCKMHGYKNLKEIIGKNLSIFHNKEQLANEVIPFNEKVKKFGTHSGEVWHIDKKGKSFPTLMTSTVLRDEKEKPFAISAVATDITDRKKAEQALKNSEQKYRNLFDGINDAVFVHLLKKKGFNKFVEVNSIACERYGYTREEFLSLTPEDISAREDAELRGSSKGRKELLNKGGMTFEAVHKTKQGKRIPVEISSRIFKLNNQTAILSVARDITERKIEEKKKKEYLRELEFITDTIVKLSREKNINKMCRFIGEAIHRINQNSYIVVSLYDPEVKAIKIRALIGFGKVLNRLFKIAGEDFTKISILPDEMGKSAYLYTTGKLEKIPGGMYELIAGKFPKTACRAAEKLLGIKDVYSLGFVLDDEPYGGVTFLLPEGEDINSRSAIQTLASHFSVVIRRRQAEKNLLEVQERYQALYERSLDLVFVHDFKGNFLDANKAALDLFGYTKEEIKSVNFKFLLDDKKQLPKAIGLLKELSKTGRQKKPSTFKLESKTGKNIWIETKSSVIKKNGKPYAIQGIGRDITARIRAENEKKRLQAQLLQSQKMEAIGTLAGGVAHDFNNLLTIIQGYTQLAMGNTSENTDISSNLEQIQKAAESASILTSQLLLFSREQPMEFKYLNLNTTIQGLLKMMQRIIGEDVQIKTELEPDLWKINADIGSMEQVVMNLSVNAKDAMPEGGKLRIKTDNIVVDENFCNHNREARPGKFVCLCIEDTGKGIEKENLSHIYEPFFTTKGKGKGTGLGLSVVLGVVQEHKGWIDVESDEGKGTTFRVYIPASERESKKTSMKNNKYESLKGQGENILLVEDEDNVRKFADFILQENGYRVFKAKNIMEAKKIFRNKKGNFQIVFSDVILPDGSGLKLAKELRNKKKKLAVILSSGYTDDKVPWGELQKQDFLFINKPYKIPELLELLRKAVNK